jgi:hypothetical protein
MGIEKPFDRKQSGDKETIEIYEDPYDFLGIDPTATDDEVSAKCSEINDLWVSQMDNEVYDMNSLLRVQKALKTVLKERGLLH